MFSPTTPPAGRIAKIALAISSVRLTTGSGSASPHDAVDIQAPGEHAQADQLAQADD
jgi:hypothetical protein